MVYFFISFFKVILNQFITTPEKKNYTLFFLKLMKYFIDYLLIHNVVHFYSLKVINKIKLSSLILSCL